MIPQIIRFWIGRNICGDKLSQARDILAQLSEFCGPFLGAGDSAFGATAPRVLGHSEPLGHT